MKKVRLFEGFVNEAKVNKGKVHKAAKEASYPVTLLVIDNKEIIHHELVETPMAVPAAVSVLKDKYPNAEIQVESRTGEVVFIQESVVTEADVTNESIKSGSYYFPKSSVDSSMQPVKGEIKYAVICHNTVQMGSNIMYLKSSGSTGQNFEAHILSVHDTKEEAFQAYQDAVKYDEGKTPTCVSFAYGALQVKGSNFPFDEIGGQRKTIK